MKVKQKANINIRIQISDKWNEIENLFHFWNLREL